MECFQFIDLVCYQESWQRYPRALSAIKKTDRIARDAYQSFTLWCTKGFSTAVEAITMRIPVIVAAAGGSSRCPGNKLLAPYHGKPLLQWLLQSLSSHPALGRILVVTGAQRTEVEALLFPYPQARAIFNPHWRAGLASSLRRGVEALPPTRGFLVAMGDTPFFSALTLHRLLPRTADEAARARVPVHRSEEGYPMYFPGETRSEWRYLEGEQGARTMLRQLSLVERIPVDDPGIVQDLDRPEDFPTADTLDIATIRR